MMVSLDEGSLHSPSATSDFNDSKEESMDASVENGGKGISLEYISFFLFP